MYSLRPHKIFNFVKYWKYGFRLSGVLIALALIGFIVSTVLTGAPLTLGTEFSGGTSIQINDAGSITENEMVDAFNQAANQLGYDTQISSIQTSTTMNGGNGYIIKTTDTVSTNASEIMSYVEYALGIDETTVEIETIGASWGASVIWSSIIAFFLSCLGILIVIAIRYREPRMGVVALACLFHDMIVVLGIYAWAGLFFHMEITSDVIAALLAIIGYSLYDTVVVFHRINRNASSQMKYNLFTCANQSLNEVIVRSMNTSITSIIPILFMLILGTDTLFDFAFAMFCGMIVGVYSTLAISAPLYTMWKSKEPEYVRLDQKYAYEVVQSPFTKQMMLEERKETKKRLAEEKVERKEQKLKFEEEAKRLKDEEREAEAKQKQEESSENSNDDLGSDGSKKTYDASSIDAIGAFTGERKKSNDVFSSIKDADEVASKKSSDDKASDESIAAAESDDAESVTTTTSSLEASYDVAADGRIAQSVQPEELDEASVDISDVMIDMGTGETLDDIEIKTGSQDAMDSDGESDDAKESLDE